jgi:hypothetical protein
MIAKKHPQRPLAIKGFGDFFAIIKGFGDLVIWLVHRTQQKRKEDD